MDTVKLHSAFRLNDQAFDSPETLLEFVKRHFPGHYEFLAQWFDHSPEIRLQTSGSTGKPRLLTFQKEQLVNSVRRTAQTFNLPAGITALHNLSPGFVAGKIMWVRALTLGWLLDVIQPGDPVPEKTYDFGAMVPTQVQKNLSKTHQFSTLIIGGAPLNPALENQLRSSPAKIFATYGMTETLTHVAVRPVSETAARFLKNYPANRFDLYQSLDGVTISVNKENRIEIRDKLLNIHVITNDLGEMYDQRLFRWLGRADFVINSGGIKIIPEEVERKLAPFIPFPFFIAGIPDKKWGEKLVLIIETKENINHDFLPENIPGLKYYEKPKAIFQLPKFIRTPSGKIKRKETLERFQTD